MPATALKRACSMLAPEATVVTRVLVLMMFGREPVFLGCSRRVGCHLFSPRITGSTLIFVICARKSRALPPSERRRSGRAFQSGEYSLVRPLQRGACLHRADFMAAHDAPSPLLSLSSLAFCASASHSRRRAAASTSPRRLAPKLAALLCSLSTACCQALLWASARARKTVSCSVTCLRSFSR
jgi:hypothetical protein